MSLWKLHECCNRSDFNPAQTVAASDVTKTGKSLAVQEIIRIVVAMLLEKK